MKRVAYLLTIALLLGACSPHALPQPTPVPPPPQVEEPARPPQPPPEARRLTLLAVGDMFPHLNIVAGALQPDGTYSFDRHFAAVLPHLKAADFVVADLETNFLPGAPFEGYPRFNTPRAFAEDLQRYGVDVVTTANNHAYDYGLAGLTATLDLYDELGLAHTGTARSPEEASALLVQEVDGVRLAILNYTYGYNGPELAPYGYLINILDEERLVADLARAREAADLVWVSLHFGNEDELSPSAEQERWVSLAVSHGADLVIGDHPHVTQPAYLMEAPDGRQVAVIYSLGNFVSSQYGVYNRGGVLFYVDLEVDAAGPRVVGARYLPTYTHWLPGRPESTRTLIVEEALGWCAKGSDPYLQAADCAELEAIWEHLQDHVPGSPGIELQRLTPGAP